MKPCPCCGGNWTQAWRGAADMICGVCGCRGWEANVRKEIWHTTRLFEGKPFIIAEVGSNWKTFEHCLESVVAAKAAGADAVKFQAFTHEALYGLPPAAPEPHRLKLAWLPKLKAKADEVGIELMCTAFSPALVRAVNPYVSAHKVASGDLPYPELLREVAGCGKPVVLSTGAAQPWEIDRALHILSPIDVFAGLEVVLLYCVASYPARSIDLRSIGAMRQRFGRPVGFSDHSTDYLGLPLEACTTHGATVLEKHFTAFPELETPDRGHSLTPDEFRLMVAAIRGTPPSLGPASEEEPMRLRHKRRLVATSDIGVGDIMRYGVNYGAYRTMEDDTSGITPFFDCIDGRPARQAVKRGRGIGVEDF